MSLPNKLDSILQRDGFVIFVYGPKEKGKTDCSLFLGEYCYDMGYRTMIATNIKTENYRTMQIANMPDLKAFLSSPGRKLYVLDEAGKHIKKMRFMSSKNLEIMDIIQLIRHYDAGFIGVAPSETFIDSNFLNTDILDAKIKKLTKTTAKVIDYFNNSSYFLYDIPGTSIKFNDKDTAPFEMEKKISPKELPQCCQVAYYYAEHNTMSKIGMMFTPPLVEEQVKRLLIEHLRHTMKGNEGNPKGNSLSPITPNHEV